jgi:hypothetical protein
MTSNLISGLLMIAAYVAIDFLVFKYFIHNRKGLIQILIAKYKARKNVSS